MTNLRKYVITFFNGLPASSGGAGAASYKSYLLGAIYAFMANESRETALAVYRIFFDIRRENGSGDVFAFLENFENRTAFCMDRRRDYLVHSVNTFLFGLSIFAQSPILRREWDADYAEFIKVWGTAALLHDIAYPIESAGRELTSRTTALKAFPCFSPALPAGYDGAALLQRDCGPLAGVLGIPPAELDRLLSARRSAFDHGILGAVLLLNSFNGLFERDILLQSAAAAIAHTMHQNPSVHPAALSLHKCPLAYLLTLCTALEEWSAAPDQRLNSIDEAVIFLLDEHLDITYLAKNNPLPANFAEAKQEQIARAIQTEDLFPNGMHIRCQAAVFHKAESGAGNPYYIPLSALSRLAAILYEHGRQNRRKSGGDWEPEFQSLSDELKYANFCQAELLLEKLDILGLRAVSVSEDGDAVDRISEADIRKLAEQEHGEWVRERTAQGWSYGRHLDTERKLSPYLLPHSALPEDIQEANFSAVRDIPYLLKKAGYKAIKK